MAESDQPIVHLTNAADIDGWTDGGLAPDALRNCTAVSVPCMSDDECLAVVTLFRRNDAVFTEEHLELLAGLGPVLGNALEKIIRIHHRTGFMDAMDDVFDEEFDAGDGYADPDGPEPNADDEMPF